MTSSRLWLVTGERGAGKTRFCRRVAELARKAGWQVGGVISPAVFVGQDKTGIQVESLFSGEVRPLAAKKEQPSFNRVLGEWYFDSQALEWGNGELINALAKGENQKTMDLLVIDEIGPLELLHSEGWTAALPLLNNPVYRFGLVVIRPELVETACRQLPALQGNITLTSAMNPEAEASNWWEEFSRD